MRGPESGDADPGGRWDRVHFFLKPVGEGLGALRGELSLSPEERELRRAASSVTKTMPTIVADFDDDGERIERAALAKPREIAATTARVFGEQFPAQRTALLATAGTLLGKLHTEHNWAGDVHLGMIDGFMSRFPQEMTEALADAGTADTVQAVLDTGISLLQTCESGDINEGYFKATVAKMLGNQIPQLVRLHGVSVLSALTGVAEGHGVLDMKRYANFSLKYRDGLPDPPFTATGLTGSAAAESPFTAEDAAAAWQDGTVLGRQERPPEWADLAQMAAITDQWDREYGLTAHHDDGTMLLSFSRGGDATIKNRHVLPTNQGEKVFFHSHPARDDGVYTAIVSPADMLATMSGYDYDGGYLNVVCATGVTFHTESRPATADDPKGWYLDAGEHRGTIIGLDSRSPDGATEMLAAVREEGQPFTYTINTGEDYARLLTFVHVPWPVLRDADVDLASVCFGDGLRHLRLDDSATGADAPANLAEAVRRAKTYPRRG